MWKTVKLGDVCKRITDGSHNPPKGVERSDYLMLSSKNVFDGLITFDKPRYLEANDFASENKRTDIELGDVLLTIVGTIGRCAVVEDLQTPFTLQRSVAVLKPDREILLPVYLMYALQNMSSLLNDSARGVAQKGIYLKSLKELVILLPPLAEQQRIVAKLDAAFAGIDRAIEVAEAKEAEVEKLKASLLSDLLGGDAVMWNTVKLGDALKTGAGGTPLKSKKEYYEGGNIKWLLSGAVCERDIHDSKTHISEDGLANSSAKIFPKDSVLVAMYGATAGQVGILRTEAATNQAVCGIYPSRDYLPEFLYYYLTNFKETLLLEVSGVAQPNLSQIKIKNIPLPLILLAEQQRIVAKLDATFAEIDSAKQAIQRTKENHAALKAAILAQELTPPAESEAA